MEVKWVTHKNKKILFVDYSGAQTEQQGLDILYEAIEIERNSSEKILELCDFNDMYVSRKFNQEINRLGKEVSSKKVAKTAVLGITGVKKILYNAYVLFTKEVIKLFDDQEAAKDWLVSD